MDTLATEKKAASAGNSADFLPLKNWDHIEF